MHVRLAKLTTTVLELYLRTHRQSSITDLTADVVSATSRATVPAQGSHYKADQDWLNWLEPRIWQINQRNAAPESCPLACGQRFCGLKWKHGGNILISDSPSCYKAVHDWVYDWPCMNTGLVVNPQTRWTFPETLVRHWQRETCKL